jgi:hypothetical protein
MIVIRLELDEETVEVFVDGLSTLSTARNLWGGLEIDLGDFIDFLEVLTDGTVELHDREE